MQKVRQSSNIFEKPGFWSENTENFESSNYHRVQYFLLKRLHTFPTYQCLQKWVRDFFKILVRS